MKSIIGLAAADHLDQQLVAARKTIGYQITIFILKLRLDLERQNGCKRDGAHALFIGRRNGVLVGYRAVAKCLAFVVVAVDYRFVVLSLAVHMDKFVCNRIARLIDTDFRVSIVVAIGPLVANLDFTHVASVSRVVRANLTSALCRNSLIAIKPYGRDVVVRAAV